MSITMLRYIIACGAKEVFLAGIDLGYAGRSVGEDVYYFAKCAFVNAAGQPVRSRQKTVQVVDEKLLSSLAKTELRISSAARESKAADFSKYRQLV